MIKLIFCASIFIMIQCSSYSQSLISSLNYTDTSAGIKIEMIYIAGGTFTMGCTPEQGSDCSDDEKPSHSVTLGDYYIGKYEITQKQWRCVMGFDPPELYNKGCDECPVERVSWNDVQDFIRKLNIKSGKTYSLPTESQWEYASRGGTSIDSTNAYKFSGGNTLDEIAWYYVNSHSKTHSVGRKRPNKLGIHDMSGNVWEWCSDWYGNYSKNSQTNPMGSASGRDRVSRGGSWNGDVIGCRVSVRDFNAPSSSSYYLGFRLALVP